MRWRTAVSRPAAVATALVLALTLALALTALALYERNEERLLKLKARELGLVISTLVPSLETPLATAAAIADASHGDRGRFQAFMAPYAGRGRQFSSAALWALSGAVRAPLTYVGERPALSAHPELAQGFFARARRSHALEVLGILHSRTPSLGYAYISPAPGGGGFAAYAETPLPASRRSSVADQSAFSDLNYAIFIGHSRRRSDLLLSNLHRFPVTGRQASDVVPFGAGSFTLVVTPKGSLSGGFFKALPWGIGGIGVLVALAGGILVERLVRRRRRAEELARDLDRVAEENRRLYDEQLGIAQTLQHALLPDALPELDGLRAHARYVPAGPGVDVGGDWYDVHPIDDERVLLVVGDVSGHGLGAATTMASLRHAALAYAAEGCRPGVLLERLALFVGGTARRHFATVLVALLERDRHTVSVASAGHLPPLVVSDGRARFLEMPVGPPIGVVKEVRYEEVQAQVEPGSLFLAYTDGLVERRGELLDVGLERLRAAAAHDRLPIDELLGRLTDELSSRQDDTALVGIEWQS